MTSDTQRRLRSQGIALVVAAGLAGAALALVGRVARQRAARRPAAEAASVPAAAAPSPPVIRPEPTTPALAQPQSALRERAPAWAAARALAGLAGFGCIAAAQALLLGSRRPFAPLLLFSAGALLRRPALAANSAAERVIAPPAERESARRPLNRALFWLGGGFFFALALILARLELTGGLFIFAWVMSVFAAVLLALDGAPLVSRQALAALRGWLANSSYETPLLIVIAGAALLLFAATPAPAAAVPEQIAAWDAARAIAAGRALVVNAADGGPLYHLALLLPVEAQSSLSRLQAQSALFAALSAPAVWLLARQWAGAWTGLAAAALAAVAAPTLALAAAGTPHSALAFFSALYLAALTRAFHTDRRAHAVWAGLALGLGTLIAPPLAYGLALLPLAAVCRWRDTGRFPLLPAGTALLVAAALIAPLAALPSAPRPPAPSNVLPNPQLDPAEALGHALLLFNLVSDPNPLHGIVDRPIFSPLLAAALVVGALGLAWRLYLRRRWWDALPLLALVVLLLPAAQPLELPVRYPNLQRAAAALPAALGISAWGLALLAAALRNAFGKWGTLLAAALFIGGLALISFDTRQQHAAVFLPQHDRAARSYSETLR
ncbi:MAG: glycosyltransferase family 39 protein [Aggregatilineales bacterium]